MIFQIVHATAYFLSILAALITIYAVASWSRTSSQSDMKDTLTKHTTSRHLQFPLASRQLWNEYLANRTVNLVKHKQYMPTESTHNAINDIVTGILDDFIHTWYKSVSEDPQWTSAIEFKLHSIINNLLKRMSSLDFAQFIIDFVFPIFTVHRSIDPGTSMQLQNCGNTC